MKKTNIKLKERDENEEITEREIVIAVLEIIITAIARVIICVSTIYFLGKELSGIDVGIAKVIAPLILIIWTITPIVTMILREV